MTLEKPINKSEEKVWEIEDFENSDEFLEKFLEISNKIIHHESKGSPCGGVTEVAQICFELPVVSEFNLIDWMDNNFHLDIFSKFLRNKLSEDEKEKFNQLVKKWFDKTKEQHKTSEEV